MRTILLLVLSSLALSAPAQYYYKDILGTRESSELVRTYLANKVKRVVLTSYDASNTKSDDFYVEQQFSADGSLKTITRSGLTHESILVSYFDNRGNITRTVDSSDMLVSATTYTFSPEGQLLSVVSASVDSARSSNESEQHLWQWEGKNPVRMLRIKNNRDTTYVNFKLDENGNVSEETETRRGVTSQPVYYYYNSNNQLTDIVRFSRRAGRLLPEYMFEYSDNNQVIQKITVPANSSDYLIWRYQFNSQGLKTKEKIYNKQKQVTGQIEYQYAFGS